MTTLLDLMRSIHLRDEVTGEDVYNEIPPETREALEIGLLLAEVERRMPWDRRVELEWTANRQWQATNRWNPDPVDVGAKPGHMTFVFDVSPGPIVQSRIAPTQREALTALLAQLPESGS